MDISGSLSRLRIVPAELPVPPVAHFIWIGRTLPWSHALAVASAARNGGFARVVLHLETPEAVAPYEGRGRLFLGPGAPIEVRPLLPERLIERVGSQGAVLTALYRRLEQPAGRANLLRAAILYAEGGVYLDMDTITLRSLTPLRGDPVFCGLERICLPIEVARSRALRELLRRMTAMPVERQTVRYALGTHLLQETLRTERGAGVVTHLPEVFYALAPEISEHWFKPTARVALDELLTGSARLVHWYASVRTAGRLEALTAERIRTERDTLPFAALVCRALGW